MPPGYQPFDPHQHPPAFGPMTRTPVPPSRPWHTVEEKALRAMEQEQRRQLLPQDQTLAALMMQGGMEGGGLFHHAGQSKEATGEVGVKGIAKMTLVRAQAKVAGSERWQSIAKSIRKRTEQEMDEEEDGTYKRPRLWTYFREQHPHIRGQRDDLWQVNISNILLRALELKDPMACRDKLYGLLASLVTYTDQKLYDSGKVDFARLVCLLEEPMVEWDSTVPNKKKKAKEYPVSPLCTPELAVVCSDYITSEETLRKHREKYST